MDENTLETLGVVGLQGLDDELERGIVHVGQGEAGQVEDECLCMIISQRLFASMASLW